MKPELVNPATLVTFWVLMVATCIAIWAVAIASACSLFAPKPISKADLDRAAEQRDLPAFTAKLMTMEPAAGAPPWMLARTRMVTSGCGSGARPWIMAGRASLGTVLQVAYQPFGAVASEGDNYTFPGAWAVISLQGMLQTPLRLPFGGCELWLDPFAGLTWAFGGKDGFDDPLMHRQPGARTIVLRVNIPSDTAFCGLKGWTQLVAVDGDEVKTSPVVELEFGWERYSAAR